MVGSPSGVPAPAVAAASPGNVLEMQIPSPAPPRLQVRNPGDGQEASPSPQRAWGIQAAKRGPGAAISVPDCQVLPTDSAASFLGVRFPSEADPDRE